MYNTRSLINFRRSSQLYYLVGNGQMMHITALGCSVLRSVSSQSINKTTMSAAHLERQRKMRALVNNQPMGVDISETAIKRARELAVTAPNAEYFEFLKEDFFTWAPTEQFAFIFDYTFFCAFEPQMRPAWAKRVAELLKPDGELLTLMFPVSNHEGGPPYAVSILEYEKVLHPFGFKAISIENNEMAIEQRKGREIVARWKREDSHLSLL